MYKMSCMDYFMELFIVLYVFVGVSEFLVGVCFHYMELFFKLDNGLISRVKENCFSIALFIVKMQLIKIHPSDPTRRTEPTGLGAVMVIHFPCCLAAMADERSQTRVFYGAK